MPARSAAIVTVGQDNGPFLAHPAGCHRSSSTCESFVERKRENGKHQVSDPCPECDHVSPAPAASLTQAPPPPEPWQEPLPISSFHPPPSPSVLHVQSAGASAARSSSLPCHGSLSLKGKAKVFTSTPPPPTGPVIWHLSSPSTPFQAPSLPLSPSLAPFCRQCLPATHQSAHHLRAFALAVPSAQ